MMADLYRKGGTCLDYPKGGSEAIVRALLEGIQELSPDAKVWTQAPVEEILVDEGRAVGVRLADGARVTAREAVVSGCDVGVTRRLLPDLPELQRFFEVRPFGQVSAVSGLGKSKARGLNRS